MAKRSTATNLIHITQYIAQALDKRKQVDVVYLDMSKAFDMIMHNVLLDKMDKLGFSDSLCKFFRSYLSNRSSIVVYNEFFSKKFDQTSGVPQGSNLGPLLFNLYINDLPETLTNSNFLLYADDLKIFRTIHDIEDSNTRGSKSNHKLVQGEWSFSQ